MADDWLDAGAHPSVGVLLRLQESSAGLLEARFDSLRADPRFARLLDRVRPESPALPSRGEDREGD